VNAGGGRGREASRGGNDSHRATHGRGAGWPGIRRAFRLLVAPDRIRNDIDTELRFHIEGRIEDLMARGLSRADAEREVSARFGNVDTYRAETRAIDERTTHEERRMELLETIGREMRQALRALLRSRGFTFIAILTLALGIGATTAVYTLLDRVVLNPLPYPRADRLVKIGSLVSGKTLSGEWGVSAGGYFYYLDHNRSLDALGAYAIDEASILFDDGAERVSRAGVTATLVQVLGVRASLGRMIRADDDSPGAPAVAVLSHEFWTRRFGGDPGVVGRTLTIGGAPIEVVGVLAAGENTPELSGSGLAPDVWVPLQLDPAARPMNAHFLTVIGRLKNGVTLEAATRDLASLTARFPDELPTAYSPAFMSDYHFAVKVTQLRDAVVGAVAKLLWMLLGAVGIVLVIACINVANLFLVRMEARRREAAIRTALGASRTHLAWHYLTESALLSVAAGALGLAFAYGAIHILLTLAPSGVPRLTELSLDWNSVVFTAVIAIGAGVLFGSIPLARAGLDVATLRENSRGMTPSRGRHAVRGALVVAQVALAVVLLAAAGLMLRSFSRLRHVQPGFDANGVLTLDLSLPTARYQDFRSVTMFYRDLQERIAALPGVERVAATNALPLTGRGNCSVMFARGQAAPEQGAAPCIQYAYVTPGYFAAMGIPVRGTTNEWSAVLGEYAGVVVSRAAAERFWPGENAVGKGIKGNGESFYRVIGVADDVHTDDLRVPPGALVYFPTVPAKGTELWIPPRSMTLVVRAGTADPAALTPAIRRVVAELDPGVPSAAVRTMSDVVAASMARLSFTMLLIGVAGAMALVLSAVGLYGVISYIVGERRGEIGVRMALGARAGEVGGMVMLQSVRLASIGVVIGLMGAAAATRVLRSLLFEVSPTDPLTLAAVALFLMLLAALASYAPARRAARVDPIEVLRA
jgi:predicted permease